MKYCMLVVRHTFVLVLGSTLTRWSEETRVVVWMSHAAASIKTSDGTLEWFKDTTIQYPIAAVNGYAPQWPDAHLVPTLDGSAFILGRCTLFKPGMSILI